MPATKAPTRETKTLHFSVKATGITTNAQGQEVGVIEAFGAIYGNVDEGNDRVVAGASKRTIHNSKQRAINRNKDYMLPMIWNHDTEHFLPLGGWYDVDGDNPEGLLGKAHVLLSTQTGREYYELAKASMIDTFSVIYDIPAGGAKYDKSGVREITEWRIFSIDPVIFPMNDETRLVAVKGKTMPEQNKTPPQKKTYDDHLAGEMCEDLLEDFQDVFVSAFAKAVCDAIQVADTMEADMGEACDKLKASLLATFVPQAITYGLPQYIADNSGSWSPADYLMQYGSDSRPDYGYMSSNRRRAQKTGRAFSNANSQAIQDKADQLHDLATKCMKAMKTHTDAVHSAADDLSSILGVQMDDSDGGKDEQPEGKSKARDEDKELTLALSALQGLRANR